LPEGRLEQRDLVIQFAPGPIEKASANIAELAEVLPLLERARHGIEFFGMSEHAQASWHKIRSSKGLGRFAAFCEFLARLSQCSDYRLLSHSALQSIDDHTQLDQIDAIVSRITDNLAQPITAAAMASELDMNESQFSRFFKRATGNSFTDFVIQMRINQACRLLMQSDRFITHICYEVGFNNVANFNRCFLDIKGMMPSEFRRSADTRFGISR
jgi:AraC-like DNA-binding protein